MHLEDFLYSCSIPHYRILQRQGYRILLAERHLIFYKVDEAAHTVTSYAVPDSRQEYRNLI